MKLNNRYIYGIIALILLALILFGGPPGYNKLVEVATQSIRAQAEQSKKEYQETIKSNSAEIAELKAQKGHFKRLVSEYRQREAEAKKALERAGVEAYGHDMSQIMDRMESRGYNPVVR